MIENDTSHSAHNAVQQYYSSMNALLLVFYRTEHNSVQVFGTIVFYKRETERVFSVHMYLFRLPSTGLKEIYIHPQARLVFPSLCHPFPLPTSVFGILLLFVFFPRCDLRGGLEGKKKKGLLTRLPPSHPMYYYHRWEKSFRGRSQHRCYFTG